MSESKETENNRTRSPGEASEVDSSDQFQNEDGRPVISKRPGSESRPFKPRQFLFGLALATGGMGLMLFVAAGALHDAGAGGAVSLPATGLCMIIGLMLLGGGFGQMAISSPKLDETEFQRLLAGGATDVGLHDSTHSNPHAEHAHSQPSSPDQTLLAQMETDEKKETRSAQNQSSDNVGGSVSAVFSDIATS